MGVLLGLILVEQRHDLTHHHMHRVVANLLGDRQQADAVLRQLADVELQLEMIAKEAREAVDDHDIEPRGLAGPRFDHALEFGTAVVGGGCACLNEGLDKLIGARRAVGLALLALIGDRHVMLGLPRRRDAHIKGGAQRHGHDVWLFVRSSTRPEQLIEKIAEPCLEHVNLGLRDRQSLGPVVGDRPRLKVVFDRPADARPRLEWDVRIVRHDASDGALVTVFAARGARSGHPDRIARSADKQNNPILRHGTLRATGGKYRGAAVPGGAGVTTTVLMRRLSVAEHVRSARGRGASASLPKDRRAAAHSARNRGCCRTHGRG